MKKTLRIILLWTITMISLSNAATPEEWNEKLAGAIRLKFFQTTKDEVLKAWGHPDRNLPEKLKADGVVQYLYEGRKSLPSGSPPAIRFSFDRKGRLIEVCIGSAFGPPIQEGKQRQP